MTKKDETYVGDGLYASYDGFAVWLRAPHEHGEHKVALEPQVLHNFLQFAMTINRTAKIVTAVVRERVAANEQ